MIANSSTVKMGLPFTALTTNSNPLINEGLAYNIMRSAIINEKQIFNRRVNNENIRLDENLWNWVNKMKTTFREIHIFYHNDDIVDDVVDVDDDDDSDDSDEDEIYYESYDGDD